MPCGYNACSVGVESYSPGGAAGGTFLHCGGGLELVALVWGEREDALGDRLGANRGA